jgi:hypothetical protein
LEKQQREIRVTKITKICGPYYQLHQRQQLLEQRSGQRQRVEGNLCRHAQGGSLQHFYKQKVVENHYGGLKNVIRQQFLGQRSGQRRRGEPGGRGGEKILFRRLRKKKKTFCICRRKQGTGGKATTATTSNTLHGM